MQNTGLDRLHASLDPDVKLQVWILMSLWCRCAWVLCSLQ